MTKEATIHENRAVWKRTGDTVKTIDQVLICRKLRFYVVFDYSKLNQEIIINKN